MMMLERKNNLDIAAAFMAKWISDHVEDR